jgi:hypothetical protein
MEKREVSVSGADPSLESGVVAPVIDRAAEQSYGNRLFFKQRDTTNLIGSPQTRLLPVAFLVVDVLLQLG